MLIFSVSSVSWVTVFKFFVVPPRIQSTEVHYTVNENSQAVLPCVADGIPTPAIHWEKDSVLIANLLGKYTAQPYGELILENAVVSLMDVNTCSRAK